LTKEELAKEYVQSIVNSSSKLKLIKLILNEIDNLIYKSSKKPISDIDKKWILEYIYEQLSTNKLKNGFDNLEKSADNKYYLTLISDALAILNGGKK
jgi:hypothetical protein